MSDYDPIGSTPAPDTGFWTPEHLQIAVKQGVSLAVALGILTTTEGTDLATRLAAIVGACFALMVNLSALYYFLRHQAELKTGAPPSDPDPTDTSISPPRAACWLAAVLGLAALAGPAQAQYRATSERGMLALGCPASSVCQRPDLGAAYKLMREPASNPDNWRRELASQVYQGAPARSPIVTESRAPGCSCGPTCDCPGGACPNCPQQLPGAQKLQAAPTPAAPNTPPAAETLYLNGTLQIDATALLPWRRNMEKKLDDLKKQNQGLSDQLQQQRNTPPPAAPPIIINNPAPQQMAPAQPPLQQYPIAGPPLQVYPIPGAPLQLYPQQGAPLQLLPIQGNPHLLVPIQGAPLQQLPIAQAPQQLYPQPQPLVPAPLQPLPQTPPQAAPQAPLQPLPLGPPPQQRQALPPGAAAPGQPQAYTGPRYALWR